LSAFFKKQKQTTVTTPTKSRREIGEEWKLNESRFFSIIILLS
jgi:hypothetical protein